MPYCSLDTLLSQASGSLEAQLLWEGLVFKQRLQEEVTNLERATNH